MGSVYELLKKRRMVRHYTGEPVARDALERIVATVRRAPSAGFSQGQRLLVVDDPELLARIAALGDDPLEGVEPWFETAAAQVFVMTREGDYHERYQRDEKLQDGEEIEWPVPFLARRRRRRDDAGPARRDRGGPRGGRLRNLRRR